MRHPLQFVAGLALSAIMLTVPTLVAQAPASAAKAKELTALMKDKKLEAFAMRESMLENRFDAVMVTPGVQTLLISAVYARPTDIEYWIYQKDYARAYGDLVSGTLGSDRVFVEDVLGDGLMANPVKLDVCDSITVAGKKQLFEGPADPKKHKDIRMALEPYMKMYGDADKRYASLLDSLIQELKKPVPVAPANYLR